jgi:hypothetical protein
VRAYIYPDLMDRIDLHFGGYGGHRDDPEFKRLCDRIAGKTVDLVFIGGDAFEAEDYNYLLPERCWKGVPSE